MSDYFGNYKWKKLTTAECYYSYNFEGQEHNSLALIYLLQNLSMKKY